MRSTSIPQGAPPKAAALRNQEIFPDGVSNSRARPSLYLNSLRVPRLVAFFTTGVARSPRLANFRQTPRILRVRVRGAWGSSSSFFPIQRG